VKLESQDHNPLSEDRCSKQASATRAAELVKNLVRVLAISPEDIAAVEL